MIRDSVVIDALRMLAIVTAALLLVMIGVLITRKRIGTNQPGDRSWLAGIAVFLVFSAVQEAQQLGKPFIWWRLPMLIIGNLFIGRACYQRAQADADSLKGLNDE